MKKTLLFALPCIAVSSLVYAEHSDVVPDSVIAEQRLALAENTKGKGFGPQSPRNIDEMKGSNPIAFSKAPAYQKMNLCNIHFHKNAEHAGGEFSDYAGNGDGKGYQSGYRYSGSLTGQEARPYSGEICPGEHGGLKSGDTIEVHYVHSTAQVRPGQGLGSCLSESVGNPQLRVEAQVFVLVNDEHALDFGKLTRIGKRDSVHQALHIPADTGTPTEYNGSTTGPGYNEKGSPYQVTWGVRPKVQKVNIASVGEWCEQNVFKENHAHGVRNLIQNPELLSPIQ